MRTKRLLTTLALAIAGFGTLPESGHAQTNVYSINVVGYYNVTLVPGWNLLANQLRQTNFNANCVLTPPS